jgi:hemoglobin
VPGCRALAEALYANIDRDPLLRPLFPPGGFHCAIEELSAFLVQTLGGPAEHSQRRWWLSLWESHLRFRIGPAERDAWMRNMSAALDSLPMDESTRNVFREVFEESSRYLINADGRLPESQPFPLDAAVMAVRQNDGERAIRLVSGCDSGVLCGLLALMISLGTPALIACAHEQIRRNPDLIPARYAGRTLLHSAAAAGEIGTVHLLLELGADPNSRDGGQHAPLYSAGNECRSPEGAEVVRALVRAGARVDAADGTQRCTALHMAARRGNIAVAEALLECGADIAARDRSGATPLVRARNCRRMAMAEFLASRM